MMVISINLVGRVNKILVSINLRINLLWNIKDLNKLKFPERIIDASNGMFGGFALDDNGNIYKFKNNK